MLNVSETPTVDDAVFVADMLGVLSQKVSQEENSRFLKYFHNRFKALGNCVRNVNLKETKPILLQKINKFKKNTHQNAFKKWLSLHVNNLINSCCMCKHPETSASRFLSSVPL